MKLRKLLNELSSNTVKVSGDRGVGTFKVKIIKRRQDLEHPELIGHNEEIYECVDVATQKTVFVVKGAGRSQRDKSLFGEIDPFIDIDSADY